MADNEQLDPKADLLRQYEQMVQTQISTLNEIDDRALRVSRLITLLIGIGVSLTSLAVGADLSVPSGTLFLLWVALASLAFQFSLLQAAVTYLSSSFEYGPSSRLGEVISEGRVLESEYKRFLLKGYSSAIRKNHGVVVRNARRFQRSLALLFVGVVFTITAGTAAVFDSNPAVTAISIVFSPVISYSAYWYVTREKYLTIERK